MDPKARRASAPIPTGLAGRLTVAPEVAEALAGGRPLVALESTLISHGLPYPQNVEVARAAEAAVRMSGAVPATVAIHAGRILVGLTEAQLETLATTRGVLKAARPSLSLALASGGWAATTVSGTMIAAAAAGIGVFATGGIGGVHRGALGGETVGAPAGGSGFARPTLDISSDLEELARTPVAVVCAGPKAILDVPLTLEYLETRGVPVVALGTDHVPGFWSRDSGIPAPATLPGIAEVARLVAAHDELGLGSGVLICVPVPEPDEFPLAEARPAIERALADAAAAGIEGPALTPWLLARVAELSGGRSVRANVSLIANNARVAGDLAVALADRRGRPSI